jgi:hypothetical protein
MSWRLPGQSVFSGKGFDHRLNTYTAGGQYLNRYAPQFEHDKVLNQKRTSPISDDLGTLNQEYSIYFRLGDLHTFAPIGHYAPDPVNISTNPFEAARIVEAAGIKPR